MAHSYEPDQEMLDDDAVSLATGRDTTPMRWLFVASLALFSLTTGVGAQDAQPSGPEQPRSHRRMLRQLGKIAARTPELDPYLGQGRAPELRRELALLQPGSMAPKRWDVLTALAFEELRLGESAKAIELYLEAVAIARVVEEQITKPVLYQTVFELGLAYLRWGENQNCVARHTSESCLLPIRGTGVHVNQEASRSAIALFEEILEHYPNVKTTRWLLNVAYMTVGGYPDEVPEAFLIDPKVFESDEEFPRFTDVAPDMGLNAFNLAGGTIIDDFDLDGWLDIVTSTWDPTLQMLFFKGKPDGSFVERGTQAGLAGLLGGLNMIHTDYDNDGYPDILVLRGGWLTSAGDIPNSLLHNNGDGTFTDVTFKAGLGLVHRPTQTASWADYDNDGDLDLYVGNEAEDSAPAACQLFRNQGDGTFIDVAKIAGVTNDAYAKGVIWGDYDGDRFPDLYVSNLFGKNRLYHNEGDGTFTDVAEKLGVSGPTDSFPVWFWDFDNDGALDLWVSSYTTEMSLFAASYLGEAVDVELACLYQADGKGGFKNVADASGLTRMTLPMGCNFGDIDGDGWLDFYQGTGFPGFESLTPNVMYRNRAGQTFADVTTAGGFGHLQKGHGVAFADLDYDGDQDIYIEMGGAFAGNAFGNALFKNPGFGNSWIRVKLVGVQSNRPGIGARIHCVISEDGETRSIYKHVNSGGSFGASPFTQMIGLAGAEKIDLLEIYWPTSDLTQRFKDVAINQAIVVTEGEEEFGQLPR